MSFINDIKHPFRNGNVVMQLIIINVIVFLAVNLFRLLLLIGGQTTYEIDVIFNNTVIDYLALPISFGEFIYRPWTIITSMFLHTDIAHIFWNMVVLYFFGRLLQDFMGTGKILAIYVYGAIAGALLAMVALNFIPALYHLHLNHMLGASAGIMALVITVSVLMPDFSVNMLFVGEIKLKYIALFYVVLDMISVTYSHNQGGHIAHLGGALFGYVFVVLLRKGTDLSRGFNRLIKVFRPGAKPKKRRVHEGVYYFEPKKVSDEEYNYNKQQKQKRIDTILDKISRSGYESLSREEKDFLFKNSKDV